MRIKTGPTRRRKHKKVLERTKGMRMTKGRLYKVSKQADLHAGQHAFIGRKRRKRDFRRLWIGRINAALTLTEESPKYSVFINRLKAKNIDLNRKSLAELAVNDFPAFQEVVRFSST